MAVSEVAMLTGGRPLVVVIDSDKARAAEVSQRYRNPHAEVVVKDEEDGSSWLTQLKPDLVLVGRLERPFVIPPEARSTVFVYGENFVALPELFSRISLHWLTERRW